MQVLADAHGAVVHLGERDCTIQRRHQKLVEETPSPAVTPELRERIGAIAVDAARAVGYRGAGTIEGLLDRDGNYFFLEMNTRIQVEHTVTELVTGLDLVREQVLVAAGEPLSFGQEDVRLSGHAIECRINAEDPRQGFLPAPGTIGAYREPAGPGVRVDSGVTEGSEIVGIYDPLVAKLIVWDSDRERARRRMLRALGEYVIEGVTTLLDSTGPSSSIPASSRGRRASGSSRRSPSSRPSRGLSALARPLRRARRSRSSAWSSTAAASRSRSCGPSRRTPSSHGGGERTRDGVHHAAAREAVVSPMQGTVLAVEVQDGDEVREGQVVCVVEAMKMENEITAHRPGTVSGLSVAEGEQVATGQVICVVAQEGERVTDDSL